MIALEEKHRNLCHCTYGTVSTKNYIWRGRSRVTTHGNKGVLLFCFVVGILLFQKFVVLLVY